MNHKKKNGSVLKVILYTVVAFFTVIILMGIGCSILAGGIASSISKQTNSQDQNALGINTSSSINLDNFNKISIGMTYEEILTILKVNGTLQSENSIEGIPGFSSKIETKMYAWSNNSILGGSMNIIIQNGKVFQKSQFGLK